MNCKNDSALEVPRTADVSGGFPDRHTNPFFPPPDNASQRKGHDPPAGFAAVIGLSPDAAYYYWNSVTREERQRTGEAVESFSRFVREHKGHEQVFPASASMLADYIAFLGTGSPHAPEYVEEQHSILRDVHRELRLDTSGFSSDVSKVLRGYKKVHKGQRYVGAASPMHFHRAQDSDL